MHRGNWKGLEALEPRQYLAGTVSVFGGTGLTAAIAAGDTSPSIVDSTDFWHTGVDSGAVTRQFKIVNSGADTLTFAGAKVQISGDNAADFTVTAWPADTIAAGGFSTITVAFNPAAAGLRAATVTILSSDAAQPQFAFDVQGAGLTTVNLPDGLQYAITAAGTGHTVVAGDDLLVNYTGYLLDGTKFDSSLNAGRYPFDITDIGTAALIDGWNEGLIGMRVGEHRTLIIPPDLAYGDTGSGSIPPGATLIFDIELLSANSRLELRGGTNFGYTILDSQQPTDTAYTHTHFGSVAVAGGLATWKFALANFADAAVTLSGTPLVTITGDHAADFTVTTQPASSIAAKDTDGNAGVATFDIQFNPSALGTRTAVVHLTTSADTEQDIWFAISGTGIPSILTGAVEDTPFTVSYAALYQAIYGIAPPAGAPAFRIESLTTGTLKTGAGADVVAGATTIAPGGSVVWTPAANASRTLGVCTVKVFNGAEVVGDAFALRAEVQSVDDAPTGTLANITTRTEPTAQTPSINLDTVFTDPDILGSVLQFATNMGTFYVGLFDSAGDNSDNVLDHADEDVYDRMIVHNVADGSLVRTGAYFLNDENQVAIIEALDGFAPALGLSNARGTVAIDRSIWDWNVDTCRLAFNVAANVSRDGGYSVIGEVLGNGMSVLDAIARLPKIDLTAAPYNWANPEFTNLPVTNGDFVVAGDVSEVAPLTYTVSGGGSGITAALNGSVLTVTIPANATGGATFTVRATDRGGHTLTRQFVVAAPVVNVTAKDAVAAEVTAGPRARLNNGTFVITRTGPTTSPLPVSYTVTGTATNGTDYALLSGDVTIPAGESSVTLTVTPTDDATVEPVENVTLTLVDTDEMAYLAGPNIAATITLLNNDPTGVTITPMSNTAEATPAGVAGVFQITRNDVTTEPLTLNFTAGGTARRGTDYALRLAGAATPLTARTVTIPAGQASINVEVVAVDDLLAEADETVLFTIGAGTGYTPPVAPATVTILDNEPRVSVTASQPNAAEPNTAGAFTFTRTGSTANPLTVAFTIAGTAKKGQDYVTVPTSVVIPAGSATVDVAVQPLADALVEPGETVVLTLKTSRAYSLAALPADRTATVTIADGIASPTPDPVLLSLTSRAATYSLANLAGKTVAVSGRVRNQGIAITGGDLQINVVLSPDRAFGGVGDIALGSVAVPALAGGQTASFSQPFPLAGLAGLAPGRYFVVARIGDAGNVLATMLDCIVITA